MKNLVQEGRELQKKFKERLLREGPLDKRVPTHRKYERANDLAEKLYADMQRRLPRVGKLSIGSDGLPKIDISALLSDPASVNAILSFMMKHGYTTKTGGKDDSGEFSYALYNPKDQQWVFISSNVGGKSLIQFTKGRRTTKIWRRA